MRIGQSEKIAAAVTVACVALVAVLYKECPMCGTAVTRRQIRKRVRRLAR